MPERTLLVRDEGRDVDVASFALNPGDTVSVDREDDRQVVVKIERQADADPFAVPVGTFQGTVAAPSGVTPRFSHVTRESLVEGPVAPAGPDADTGPVEEDPDISPGPGIDLHTDEEVNPDEDQEAGDRTAGGEPTGAPTTGGSVTAPADDDNEEPRAQEE